MISRADHSKNFTVISGETITDYDLSTEALGLLVRMLAMRDDWEFSINGMAYQFRMSKKTILRLVTELKQKGYIEIEHRKNKNGQFIGCAWKVNEIAHNSLFGNSANGNSVYGNSANGNSEKGNILTNTNITNIDKTNIDITSIRYGEFQNVLLSNSQFEKLAEKLGKETRDGLIYELSCYLCNHPRKYKDHYATILSWARKREQSQTRPIKPIEEEENVWDRIIREEGWK